MRDLKTEIDFGFLMMKSYRLSMQEIVACRLELGDIEAKYQPIKAHRTDREVLQNYFKENTQHIFEKIREEEEIKKRFDEANLVLNRVEEIMRYVIDPIEKDMLEYLYMSSVKHTRQDFALKFNYDVNSISKKILRIIEKSMIRKGRKKAL